MLRRKSLQDVCVLCAQRGMQIDHRQQLCFQHCPAVGVHADSPFIPSKVRHLCDLTQRSPPSRLRITISFRLQVFQLEQQEAMIPRLSRWLAAALRREGAATTGQ